MRLLFDMKLGGIKGWVVKRLIKVRNNYLKKLYYSNLVTLYRLTFRIFKNIFTPYSPSFLYHLQYILVDFVSFFP